MCCLSLIRSSRYPVVSQANFEGGIACDLERDTPEAMLKLDGKLYDYDSDSDLESLFDEESEPKTSLITRKEDREESPEGQTSTVNESVSVGKMPESSLQWVSLRLV